jgi:hypothetical protein
VIWLKSFLSDKEVNEMKKTIILLLVVGVCLCVALPAVSMPQGASQLSFSGQTMAEVDFSHESHKGYADNCKSCHHLGVGTGSCDDCHGSDSRVISKKRAFHKSCKGCHAAKGVSGRRDCQFCHKG